MGDARRLGEMLILLAVLQMVEPVSSSDVSFPSMSNKHEVAPRLQDMQMCCFEHAEETTCCVAPPKIFICRTFKMLLFW
jgi:hypothetical protein